MQGTGPEISNEVVRPPPPCPPPGLGQCAGGAGPEARWSPTSSSSPGHSTSFGNQGLFLLQAGRTHILEGSAQGCLSTCCPGDVGHVCCPASSTPSGRVNIVGETGELECSGLGALMTLGVSGMSHRPLRPVPGCAPRPWLLRHQAEPPSLPTPWRASHDQPPEL